MLPSFVAHRRFDFSHIIATIRHIQLIRFCDLSYTFTASLHWLLPKGDSLLWSPKRFVGFRVSINDNDGDWEMVCDDGLMMNIDGDGHIVV